MFMQEHSHTFPFFILSWSKYYCLWQLKSTDIQAWRLFKDTFWFFSRRNTQGVAAVMGRIQKCPGGAPPAALLYCLYSGSSHSTSTANGWYFRMTHAAVGSGMGSKGCSSMLRTTQASSRVKTTSSTFAEVRTGMPMYNGHMPIK